MAQADFLFDFSIDGVASPPNTFSFGLSQTLPFTSHALVKNPFFYA